jgi:asparagine synthase (glutamine-hydrolysing)
MCGISGFVTMVAGAEAPDVLRSMVASLAHRGPDAEGSFVRPEVAFGHRRLSVIDLSDAARQPMADATGAIRIVFNGEIYNYRELDQELKAKGYAYRTQSDTETIIHAYEEWGDGCISRFNGMFAFAIWDGRARRLFCARDRFGEKPFYYTIVGGRFLFASEIKALLCDPAVARTPDEAIIRRYLEENLTDVDASTFFQGIRSLPPAHSLTVQDGAIRVAQYWSLPGETSEHRSVEDWIEEFREILTDSVRLRLRSDVPVGTCLSGGLDSSSIITLVSRLVDGPVSAFSVVYDDAGFAEGAFVKAAQQGLRVDGHLVTPNGTDLYPTLARLVWHNDEPSSSYGMYSQWHVMRLAAEQGVTVILNGQGGDELLGGYHRYLPTYLRELFGTGRWGWAWTELRGARTVASRSIVENLKQVWYPSLPAGVQCLYRRFVTARAHTADFLDPAFRSQTDTVTGEPPELFHTLSAHLAHDLCVTSVPALVHQEDRASMAFSREIRLPFLDPRLVELVTRMPSSLKIQRGVTKYVLRRAMEQEKLSASVVARSDKKGYPTPMGKWFATVAWDETRELLWSESFRQRGFVNVKKAREAFIQHVNAEADYTLPIWQWVNLELWFRTFIDVKPVAAASVLGA